MTYVGCLTAPRSRPSREPAPAVPLRMGLADVHPGRPRGLTGVGLIVLAEGGELRGGLADSWETAAGGKRWTFHLRSTGGAPPDSGTPGADAIAAAWLAALRRPDSPSRWLLADVVGTPDFVSGERSVVEGLTTPADDRLVLTLRRPLPDLPERLSHPSLELPIPSRIEVLDGDPALLLRIGEVDAALVYGVDADRVLREAPPGWTVERAPGWDLTYALWLNSASSTLQHRGAREHLVGSLDPSATARQMFGHRAVAASSLLHLDAPDDRPEGRDGGAATAGARRVGLLFSREDPLASAVASRVRAELLSEGWTVGPEPAGRDRYTRRLGEGSFDMALLAHRASTPDPLLRLGLTLWRLDTVAADALADIARAAATANAAWRASEALRIESRLIGDRRLVPLLRVEAWLIRRERIVDPVALSWLGLSVGRERRKR